VHPRRLHGNIFGYFYDIDTGMLTEIVTEKAKVALQVWLDVGSTAASTTGGCLAFTMRLVSLLDFSRRLTGLLLLPVVRQ
jgi:hypothetical protein